MVKGLLSIGKLSPRTAIILLVIDLVIVAGARFCAKNGAAYMPSTILVAVRQMAGFVLFLPLLWAAIRDGSFHRAGWPPVLVGFCLLAANELFFFSLRGLPLSVASAVQQTNVLLIPLVGWFLAREKTAATAWMALIIGFVGALCMRPPGGGVIAEFLAAGLCSALLAAIGLGVTKHRAGDVPAAVTTLWIILVGTVVSSLVVTAQHGIAIVANVPLSGWLWSAGAGVLACLSMLVAMMAISAIPSAVYAAFTLLPVALALPADAFWFDRMPSMAEAFGMALIVASLVGIKVAAMRPPRLQAVQNGRS